MPPNGGGLPREQREVDDRLPQILRAGGARSEEIARQRKTGPPEAHSFGVYIQSPRRPGLALEPPARRRRLAPRYRNLLHQYDSLAHRNGTRGCGSLFMDYRSRALQGSGGKHFVPTHVPRRPLHASLKQLRGGKGLLPADSCRERLGGPEPRIRVQRGTTALRPDRLEMVRESLQAGGGISPRDRPPRRLHS